MYILGPQSQDILHTVQIRDECMEKQIVDMPVPHYHGYCGGDNHFERAHVRAPFF